MYVHAVRTYVCMYMCTAYPVHYRVIADSVYCVCATLQRQTELSYISFDSLQTDSRTVESFIVSFDFLTNRQ